MEVRALSRVARRVREAEELMSVTTVFKDKLGAGTSFPLGNEALATRLEHEVVALYLVATATWVRQVKPLDGPRLPVLRLQRSRVLLRVRNDRIAPLPEGCSLHAIAYAVPSGVRKVASDALASHVADWAVGGKARADLIVFLDLPDRLTIEAKLPNWW